MSDRTTHTNGHRATEIRHPRYGTVLIDNDLVPTITALWQRGINTISSCQNIANRTHIQLATMFDAKYLLGFIPDNYPMRRWRLEIELDRTPYAPTLTIPRADLALLERSVAL